MQIAFENLDGYDPDRNRPINAHLQSGSGGCREGRLIPEPTVVNSTLFSPSSSSPPSSHSPSSNRVLDVLLHLAIVLQTPCRSPPSSRVLDA